MAATRKSAWVNMLKVHTASHSESVSTESGVRPRDCSSNLIIIKEGLIIIKSSVIIIKEGLATAPRTSSRNEAHACRPRAL